MNEVSSFDPGERQVLARVGNRFVVFGSEAGLPNAVRFGPDDSPPVQRIADETEAAEAMIVSTLQIHGMTRVAGDPGRGSNYDVAFVDPSGRRVLIDVKTRARDPKDRDFRQIAERLLSERPQEAQPEVWFFNIERLKLTMMRFDKSIPHFQELVPLDVWEKTTEGVFERRRVVDEVDDWVRRLDRLYADVCAWLAAREGFRCEQTRTVTMSDEMMQKFAVMDRPLPILDVSHLGDVVASFVPRGLWLIGAWGRVDIITRDRTSILLAIKQAERFEWLLTSSEDRRQKRPFDQSVVLDLVGVK